MAVKMFGVAKPVAINFVQQGMVLVASDHQGHRLAGIAVEGPYGPLFAVIWSAGETSPPYIVELSDAHQSLSVIDGELEIEPTEPFVALTERALRSEGLFVTSDGRVGLAVGLPTHTSHTNQRRHFDLSDGAPMTSNGGAHGMLGEARVYVRQEGREDRLLLWPQK